MNKSSIFYKWIPFEGTTENPLVFLHGFLETHKIWYNLPLSQLKRPILLIDLPGFGQSNLLDDLQPSIAYYALEIQTLLLQYKVIEFDLVGHSLGGYVGLELLQINSNCTKLVLLNSNFWSDPTTKKKDRTRVADILLKAKDLFINEAIPALFVDKLKSKKHIFELVTEAKKGTAEWYAYASLAMRERTDFTQYVLENSSKVAIIHGELDNLVSTKQLTTNTKGLLELHLVRDSGHMSLFEKPIEVVNYLNKILG